MGLMQAAAASGVPGDRPMPASTGATAEGPPLMDLLYQSVNQTLAHRAVQYFHQRHEVAGVPDGFARDAREVGPHTNHNGPRLALFRGVALSHDVTAFRAWWDSTPWLERACSRLIWVDGQRPPAPTRAALAEEIVALAAPQLAGATLRLHIHPRTIELSVGDDLVPFGFTFHPVHFTHVLYVAQLEEGFAWSVRPREWLWTVGCDKPPKYGGSPATAVYKLDEALQVMGAAERGRACSGAWSIDATVAQPPAAAGAQAHANGAAAAPLLQPDGCCCAEPQACDTRPRAPSCPLGASPAPAPWHLKGSSLRGERLRWACDLGAAPGAWTGYLAAHCSDGGVVAVDPAELAPDVLALPNVHHVRQKSEDAVPAIRQLLGGCPLDLLACDMNMHPFDMKDVVMPLLPLLRPGGLCILTLKFFGFARDRARAAVALNKAFQDVLEDGIMVWLMANTQNERCYIARRKALQ